MDADIVSPQAEPWWVQLLSSAERRVNVRRQLYNWVMHDPSSKPTSNSSGATFRIVHVMYVITLLASSLAAFGTDGILPSVLLSIFWGVVFAARSRPKGLAYAILAALGISLLASATRHEY